VIVNVRRTMKFALLCVVTFAMIAIIGRSVWRMSQRSSAVKDRAATVFAGRSSLSRNEFAALFPTTTRSIAARLQEMLAGVLIVDAKLVRPEDRLISDLGLGHVDGLDAYHLDGDVKSEYNISLLPLFEELGDPSVADVVQYVAKESTTNNPMDRSGGSAAC
jgi:acyl carrier protein